MDFNNVEIPEGLTSAALSGHLVIFAGAGVSMQDPVCLPSFNKLVGQIKDEVDPRNLLRSRRYKVSQDGKGKVYTETPEQYLSYLDRETGIVRRECCKVLSSGGQTSELHRNLLRLFPEGIPPKIVTTNFDDCFEVALKETGEDYEAYSSPALPYGDGFSGLIHLHGLTSKPASMVLLAEDYGKAYVTNGWASRFLVDLFKEYSVLFVGYSCGDSPVDYLTRSISGHMVGNAYALCKSDEDSSDWFIRGVTPISFMRYEDLPIAIGEWAGYLEQSVTDRVRRLREIADHAELNSDDEEYVLRSLEWPDEDDRALFAHEFCSVSTSFEHLVLLDKYGKTAFLTCSEPSDTELELLRWTISSFSVGNCAELQRLCDSISGSPSPHFSSELVRHLVLSDAPSEVVGAWVAWLELMPIQHHSRCSYYLLELANKCEVSGVVLAIIRMLLHVSLSASKDAYFNNGREVAVAINDKYYEDKIIECLHRHRETIGDRVFDYCVEQIEIAYSIQTNAWTHPDASDFISLSRASIGPHNQDQNIHGATSILLDMARESVVPGSADGAIRRCLESRCSVLIRLGLWLTSEYRCTGEALRLLQDGDYLSNSYLRHEVFQLMGSSFSVATGEQKDAFANYLKLHFSSREGSDYELFSICRWILETSSCDKITELMDTILAAHPDYQPNEHPDFMRYFSVGFADHSSSCRIDVNLFTKEEMTRRISRPAEPGSFITELEIVSAPCRDYPEKAFEMIGELLAGGRTQEETHLCNLLVGSVDWTFSGITMQDAGKLFTDICGQPDLCVEGIRALYSSSISGENRIKWTASALADILLSASQNVDKYLEASSVEPREDSDWLLVGINHPAGKYLRLIAELDRVSLRESRRHSEFAKQLLSRLNPVSLKESVGSRALIACYFEDFNTWSELDKSYAQISTALLSDDGWALVPAWQGVARLRSLTPTAWRLTKNSWNRLFSGCIDVGEERLDELARLYVRIAIVHSNDNREKSQMLKSCGLGTGRVFEASCHQIDNWLGTLDDEGRLEAWRDWLSESFRFVADRMPDGGDVLANMYCRWLRVFPDLRPCIAEALERDCVGIKEKDLFVYEGTLTDIAQDRSLTPSRAASVVSFLLEHQHHFVYQEDAREAAKCIDVDALSDSEKRRLEDAYTRRGMFGVFGEGRQRQPQSDGLQDGPSWQLSPRRL